MLTSCDIKTNKKLITGLMPSLKLRSTWECSNAGVKSLRLSPLKGKHGVPYPFHRRCLNFASPTNTTVRATPHRVEFFHVINLKTPCVTIGRRYYIPSVSKFYSNFPSSGCSTGERFHRLFGKFSTRRGSILLTV